MNRPDKNHYYLNIAAAVSKRSTCLKNQCGAVIVKNDVVVSTGYNGSPRGRKNCIDVGECYRVKHNIPSGTMYEKCLDGSTPIRLASGISMKIADLAGMPDDELPEVLAYDVKKGEIVPVKPITARITGHTVNRWVNEFEGGGRINSTYDHPYLVYNPDGHHTYIGAESLLQYALIVGAQNTAEGWVPHNAKVISSYETTVPLSQQNVYDLEIPDYENFAVELGGGRIAFVHNCVSSHGEQNAIIAASREEMLHSTMYIYQYDLLGKCVRKNPGACQMCQRMIINAGIEEVIFADPDGLHFDPEFGYGIRVQKVADWVNVEEEPPIG